jgi:hypothetical protein
MDQASGDSLTKCGNRITLFIPLKKLPKQTPPLPIQLHIHAALMLSPERTIEDTSIQPIHTTPPTQHEDLISPSEEIIVIPRRS